jgi:hypothetical protein
MKKLIDMPKEEMMEDIKRQVGVTRGKTIYRILCTPLEEIALEHALEEGYNFERNRTSTSLISSDGDDVRYNIYKISKKK